MKWVARMRRVRDEHQEHRRSPRCPGGALVAHYWTGGAPSPRTVSNVSVDGAYIEAPDKWYPGTVITLIFQLRAGQPAGAEDQPPAAGQMSPCTVRAVVVRSAPDGFGVEFLFGDHGERSDFQQFLRETVGLSVASGKPLPRSKSAGGS